MTQTSICIPDQYITYNRKSEEKKAHMKEFMNIIFFAMAALFIFIIVLFLLPERTAEAKYNTTSEYHITSVQIQEGDSLWSIAKTYYTEDFSSLSSYMKEIKRMNCMENDKIFAGGYLLIPYYE